MQIRRILKGSFAYYHEWRTHLSLGMDCPFSRAVHPPGEGEVIEVPEVGGMHHHYLRRVA
jgi:putative transposase